LDKNFNLKDILTNSDVFIEKIENKNEYFQNIPQILLNNIKTDPN